MPEIRVTSCNPDRRIAAIKALRQVAGVGLRDAKNIVDLLPLKSTEIEVENGCDDEGRPIAWTDALDAGEVTWDYAEPPTPEVMGLALRAAARGLTATDLRFLAGDDLTPLRRAADVLVSAGLA